MKLITNTCLATLLIVASVTFTRCTVSSGVSATASYSNPAWGPSEYSGVRYYYLPDIETYYDLSSRDFVYMNNGQWNYSGSLPAMYSNYDLYNGFVVTLNYNVYQPWMHQQYYAAHYPRYYYRNTYRNAAANNLRGFNENDRKPFYWKGDERTRRNDVRDNNVNDRRNEVTRPPQNPNYRGREVGRPVKVQPGMREKKQGEKERKGRNG